MFAITVCFFGACAPKDNEIPEDIIPINKMKVVVWDMVQAGSYATYLEESDTSIKKLNTVYLAQVLKLHKLDKTSFFKSFDFYQQHPPLNKELFDSVSAYAQLQRSELYKKRSE